MDHDYIKYLKNNNPALRLLRLDTAPLIISFLFKTFKSKTSSIMGSNEITGRLSDYLYLLNQPDEVYPLPPQEYLEKWANEGFLRTWYEQGNDEPLFELTPSTERVIELIKELERKDFVGTESRFLSIFSILKDIAYKNFYSPEKRIEELERQKKQIDLEIEQVRSGISEKMDQTKVKERYMEAEETARRLLSDFKQIEQNFRDLDREARRKQLVSKLPRGKVLDDIFHSHDLIWETDQGKSFKAFWELLMSAEKQNELNELLEVTMNIPEVQEVKKENVLERLKINLLEAGDKVNKTNHLIIEQLRRYISSRNYIENKRLMEIIHNIESLALKVKNEIPENKPFIQIEDKLKLDFVMERPLFNPPSVPEIHDFDIEDGFSDINPTQLYKQLFIDSDELKANIMNLLKKKKQVSLGEVCSSYPIQKGLAELITYFSLATKSNNSIINDEESELIPVYNNETGKLFELKVPHTLFSR